MRDRARQVAERGTIAARAVAALVGAAWSAPQAVEAVPVATRSAPEALAPGRPLRLLTWNVQYCAGRGRHFFYDGGRDVHVPPGEVWPIVDRIGAVLREERADIVLLQEVDRRSDRTGRIDQHAELLERAPYACHCSVPYHRVAYIPHPPHAHLGRMDLHLSLFSRFPIVAARRIALPPIASAGWLRRQFELRRAILEVDLALTDGRVLRVGNLHLAAFSGGDGTLRQQVARAHDRLAIARHLHTPMIVAGDFNALPPGDDPLRLGSAAVDYLDDLDVLAPLFAEYTPAVARERHEDEPERWRTYLPPGAGAAERALDHAFATDVEILDASVLTAHHALSDHLPLRVELEIARVP